MFEKLRPDQDLQCYFERPSGIASISAASPTGFTVSGTWRQQFDWSVIEWNRDNVFEHPHFRTLPDGNLSGLTLSYVETRTNCIPVDSDLFPTVDWPFLRLWTVVNGREEFHQVPLASLVEPVQGVYAPASLSLTLAGAATTGDHVGFVILGERYNHEMASGDTADGAVQDLVNQVNNHSAYCIGQVDGPVLSLYFVGQLPGGTRASLSTSRSGLNGNRIALYTYVSGSKTETWDASWRQFSGGTSPTSWRYTIPFAALTNRFGESVPTSDVRKIRWTYAAELQRQDYARSEFSATVSEWTVIGTGREQRVAGPGSRRIDSGWKGITYSDGWAKGEGNFFGGTIAYTTQVGSSATLSYDASTTHELYLGTRLTFNGSSAKVTVDSRPPLTIDLFVPGEDILVRRSLGVLGAGRHFVRIEHLSSTSNAGSPQYLYFDFVELAVPSAQGPGATIEAKITLATDWDTDHSLPLAPERTARMLAELGFKGRHNFYVGALWFYELYRKDHSYAAKTITFAGTITPESVISLSIVRDDYPPETATVLNHLTWHGDSAETIALAFANEINRGYTAVRASTNGNVLSIVSRSMGSDGNHLRVTATGGGGLEANVAGGSAFLGGVDGLWTTDLSASPRINRACRDWSRSFVTALRAQGIDASAAFSTELQHGDVSVEAGIAQRYPDQSPVVLNTPAIQTNFSPASLNYWREVYRDMAQLMAEAGMQPYLQFGEVQWWYFPKRSGQALVGMPFYDEYTMSECSRRFGHPIGLILSDADDPALFPDESQLLPALIGEFTDAIIAFVRLSHPSARFEVLYPTDVNAGRLNRRINYPLSSWTPGALENLKTESFIYTLERRLKESTSETIDFGAHLGFGPTQRSHLVGISRPSTAWLKETRIAEARTQDSVVLFALDQFCLIGYPLPMRRGSRRALRSGS